MNIILLILFSALCLFSVSLAACNGRLSDFFCGNSEVVSHNCGNRILSFLQKQEKKIVLL